MAQHRSKFSGRRTALAAATLCASLSPAWGLVVVSGNANVYPQFIAIGPGDTDLGGNTLGLGGGGIGGLVVDAGSLLSAASIRFADGGNGVATGLVDGVGSRVNLTGNGNTNRLELGAWGKGTLTVSGGATLDGRANSADCLLGARWCHNFIGNAAGSEALLTITGAGSNASFLRGFTVGGLAVFRPPIENFTFGTPGGTTRGTVNVLAGGTLVTDQATLGVAPGGSSPMGSERSFADVSIDGVGSLWRLTGSTLEPGNYANLSTATHRNAWATLAITGGGEMRLEGDGNKYTVVNLSSGGGRTDMLVSGAGSRLHFVGPSGIFNIGTSAFGTATVELRDGALADGMFYTGVGRNGGVASLLVDGAGTSMRIDGTATAAANGNSAPAYMEMGRNGGNGSVTVSNGGRIEVLATQGFTNGTGMGIGRDANSAGTLNIQSGGVVLFRSSSSAPGTAAETANPSVLVGREGAGTLNISGGGKLLLEGGAVSTPADRRSTNLFIGGRNDTDVGGKGVATVTGAGSEIRLTGQDSFIGVGIGPQSNGQLTVSNLAQISANGINVGRSGGVGVLKVDGATLAFSGQQTAGNQSGAFFGIGSGGGIGVATLGNGSLVTLNNMGSAGGGVTIGGSSAFPGGDGSLTLLGGSRIEAHTQPGLNSFTVGREGSGFVRLRSASSIDLVDGVMQVARNSGSDGTVIVSEGSTITAGWLGVGARKTDTGNADGGTGTFVLINSTLNAGQIVIGTNGFLGGTGTINGLVTNRGIFSPGNSPGRLEINGGFVAEAGSRMILEVQADGQGGFKTDELVFSAGQPLDLSALKVEFRFLGATDPTAFNHSGHFSTNTFFQVKDAQGGLGVLAPEFFATAQFSATAEAYTINNFSFDAGAVVQQFSAAPVPEPGSAATLAAGLAALGWLARRRRSA